MKTIRLGWIFAAVGVLGQVTRQKPFFEMGMVVQSDGKDFATNSIPCVTATPGGHLIAVWTAAANTPKAKSRIAGALSSDGGRSWSAPFLIIDNPGKEDADPSLVIDGKRILVLSTTLPIPEKILATEIWIAASDDEGKTWSKPVLATHPHRYAEGKVHVGHKLKDGRLAVGYAWDIFCEKGMSPATEGEMDNRAGLMFSSDGGRHWAPGGDIYARPEKLTPYAVNGMDEPATVVLENGDLFALLRNGTDHLWQNYSTDNGSTWSTPVPSPLTGHNAPAALWRLRGGSEVVVAWDNSPRHRHPLAAALSRDGAKSWSRPVTIVETDGPQASYPSVTQTQEGTIVVVWQQDPPGGKGRDIRLARFNREWLLR
jgi:predicted neuraminidase